MKKILSVTALCLAAVLAISSCEKQIVNDRPSVKTVTFDATLNQTKAVFGALSGGAYPTTWTAADQSAGAKISLNYASAKDAEVAANGATATLTAEIADDATGNYTFYALSPKSAYVSVRSTYSSWTLNIPSSQTPGTGTPDEAAMVLAAKSAHFTAFPTSVPLAFSHVTAYLKLSVNNLAMQADETLESISLTFATPVAGRWYYYPETGSVTANSASSTINLSTSATSDIFVALAPVASADLGGTKLDVTIASNKANTYSKSFTLPATAELVSGAVNSLALNFSGVSATAPEVYNLVTSTDQITDGAVVIIAATDADYAISTTQNSSNRAAAVITKSGTTVTSPAADVEIFTLEAGTKASSIAFKTHDGQYIYGGGASNNYMKTQSNLDANASFTISIASGVSTLLCVGTGQHMSYNPNGGNPLFSCYKSASTIENMVALYVKEGSGTGNKLIVPVLATPANLEAISVGNDVTVAWDAVANADRYLVTCTGQANQTVTTTDADFTGLADGNYTITVQAISDNHTLYLDSEVATTSVTVGSSTTPSPVTMNVFANQATKTGSGATETVTWTSGDITVSAVRNEETNTQFRNTDADHTRFYKGWTVSVSSASNSISSIEFTCTATSYATDLAGAIGSAATASGSIVTVSGVADSSLSCTMTAQVRISQIKVIYQ